MTKKILLFAGIICSILQSKSQLTFIGEDVVKDKTDGYAKMYKTSAAVDQNGIIYFNSPNGYLYQTNGTENSAIKLDKFAAQNAMFLAASKQFVYYSLSSSGSSIAQNYGDGYRIVAQYNVATGKKNYDLKRPGSYEVLSVNGIANVSEMFQGYDRDKLFIRTFQKDRFSVYAVHDNNAAAVYEVFSGEFSSANNYNLNISTYSQVADRGDDVFVNGRSKQTGTYETTSTIIRNNGVSPNYSFLTHFALKEKGLTMFDNFLRTDSVIYSLCKLEKEGKTEYSLFRYKEKTISGWTVNLSTLDPDYAAQVLNGVIYISNKGELQNFDEAYKKINKRFKAFSSNAGWAELQKGKRFLKAGNFLLAKIGNEYQVLNEKSGIWNKMKTPVLAVEPNRFRSTESYAYAGRQHFFFIDTTNGVEQFTKYNPLQNTYEVISFPAYKKETFNSIKAILQHNDGFVLLTAYNDKKGNPVYKMFNYKEEIIAAPAVAENGSPATKKMEPPAPVTIVQEKSSHKINNKTSKIIFEETFKNNKNNWQLDKNISADSAAIAIKDGRLIFDNKQNKMSFVGIKVPEKAGIALASDEEWIVKVNTKNVNGVTHSLFGVHFGEMNNGTIEEGLLFATDAERKSYSVYNKKGISYNTLKSWTPDPVIKRAKETNELQVIKRGNRLSFLINGKFVFQTTGQYLTKAIGFTVQNKQTVEFEGVSIESYSTTAGKTERDKVNDLVTIFKASDSSFKNHYLPSNSIKKESWLPIIDNGENQFYVYEGIPIALEKTGFRSAVYYENTTSTTDIKIKEEKTIQLTKLVEAGLGNYSKRAISTALGTTIYWQSNNTALPKELIVMVENFEISGLYFTKLIVVDGPGTQLPEMQER